ncbi:hypothetical protein EVAR_44538_1 [Eumeta japonica]|uniref:Uncharacterized protein n=1 Tax=Eumeta variegata TaxID=151549 RepID=A0A4C1XAC1_EUMVA|nr:hypothetical protein EVAR_44538_1 [Eumeta japonica]
MRRSGGISNAVTSFNYTSIAAAGERDDFSGNDSRIGTGGRSVTPAVVGLMGKHAIRPIYHDDRSAVSGEERSRRPGHALKYTFNAVVH